MVSFTRKAHRAWHILRWRHLSWRRQSVADAHFLGRVAGCDDNGLRPAILVHSHRRSGTHFLIDTLRAHFDVAGDWFHLEEDFYARLAQAPVVLKSHERAWGEKIRSPDYWHSYLHWVAASACYSSAFHIHIVRDPRDVMRSQFYFDMKGHESAYKIRPGTDFHAYLRAPSARDPERRLSQIGFWCAHVAAWSRRPDVHLVRYEDLMTDPSRELARLAGFLKMQMRPARWLPASAIGRQTSARMAKTAPAVWGAREEQLLQAECLRFSLPELGYGLSRRTAPALRSANCFNSREGEHHMARPAR